MSYRWTDDKAEADGPEEERCEHCHRVVDARDIVQVPAVGRICIACDDELFADEMRRRASVDGENEEDEAYEMKP